jgi:predicted RNA-binding Zn-ribbon protein involved in translation (DUF1610 family)
MKDWKCPKCGNKHIERITPNCWQSDLIEDVEIRFDGRLVIVVEETTFEGGSKPFYRCTNCGEEIGEREIRELAQSKEKP